MKGCDLDLIAAIAPHVPVPVIYSGGVGCVQHVLDALAAGADAVAMGSALHYGKLIIAEVEHGIAESQLSGQSGQSRAACA